MQSSKCKILILARSHPYWGGVEQWLGNLYRTIRSCDKYELKLALMEGNRFNQPKKFSQAQSIPEFDTVTVKSGSAKAKRVFLERLLRTKCPDIVIPVLCRDALEVSCKLKSELKYKVLYPTHEYSVEVQNDIDTMSDRIDHIVTVDQLYLQYLQHSLNTKQIKLSQIPTSYPTHLMADHGPSLMPDLGTLEIGFCGRLNSDQKQSSTFIELIERFSHREAVTFHWMGEDIESLNDNPVCEKAIKQGRLVPYGSLYGTDNRFFFEKINCALICSNGETGPIFAWEAMVSGKLLITSSYLGSVAEGLLRHGENCLIYEVGNTEQCFNLINSVLTGSEKPQEIVMKAYEDVRNFRNPINERNGWLEILEHYSPKESRTVKFAFNLRRLINHIDFWTQHTLEKLRMILRDQYTPTSARSEWQQHIPTSKSSKLFLEDLARFESRLSKQKNN